MNFLLKEDGSYLLQENGDKIVLQEGSSPSPSSSVSPSPSASVSPSVSSSLSLSASPSPSQGYVIYTRGDEVVLPTTSNDLETAYSDQEEITVFTRNDVSVGQTGALEYMLHQFKNFVGGNTVCTIEFEGHSSLAPGLSPVYLQIFNWNTNLWETIASNTSSPADVDFELEKKITDLTNYKDAEQMITCRVYQLAI